MLENVQPGDTLILHGRNRRGMTTVTRLTKTQIVTKRGKFRKDTGWLVGSDIWSVLKAAVPKTDDIAEILKERLQSKLVCQVDACHINRLREMSVEKLQQLNTILETP